MLASVLAGIALGSASAAPLLRRGRRRLQVLTVVQLAIAVAAVLSVNTLGRFESANEVMAPVLLRLDLDGYLAPIVAASLAAMLPTTLLLGFAFPIGLALWAGRDGSPSRIGLFYSLNVCGAIAGSIFGGFVFLPLMGSRGSLIASASLALLSSIALALSQWKDRPNFAGFTSIVGPAVFGMCALNATNPFDFIARAEHRTRVLWREEGVQTTVAVHEQRGSVIQRTMLLAGMHQASDLPQMAFGHHRIGALPVMLHPNPREALVVGLGGGATAGAVARFPGVHVGRRRALGRRRPRRRLLLAHQFRPAPAPECDASRG
jgi:spermidine synthase